MNDIPTAAGTTGPQLWIVRDASGVTWLCKCEPIDFNGRLWDLQGELVQWMNPQMVEMEPGTKARLIIDPASVVSATDASTDGSCEQKTTAATASP